MTKKELMEMTALSQATQQLYTHLARRAMELQLIPQTDDMLQAMGDVLMLEPDSIIKLQDEDQRDIIKVLLALEQQQMLLLQRQDAIIRDTKEQSNGKEESEGSGAGCRGILEEDDAAAAGCEGAVLRRIKEEDTAGSERQEGAGEGHEG